MLLKRTFKTYGSRYKACTVAVDLMLSFWARQSS